jgi:hypothetical protein
MFCPCQETINGPASATYASCTHVVPTLQNQRRLFLSTKRSPRTALVHPRLLEDGEDPLFARHFGLKRIGRVIPVSPERKDAQVTEVKAVRERRPSRRSHRDEDPERECQPHNSRR